MISCLLLALKRPSQQKCGSSHLLHMTHWNIIFLAISPGPSEFVRKPAVLSCSAGMSALPCSPLSAIRSSRKSLQSSTPYMHRSASNAKNSRTPMFQSPASLSASFTVPCNQRLRPLSQMSVPVMIAFRTAPIEYSRYDPPAFHPCRQSRLAYCVIHTTKMARTGCRSTLLLCFLQSPDPTMHSKSVN
jgi:hypothetical protein